jgi:hypothetical protein
MYKLQKNPNINVVDVVVNLITWASIPFDPTNIDYQAYLKWLSEGNTPLPAEE